MPGAVVEGSGDIATSAIPESGTYTYKQSGTQFAGEGVPDPGPRPDTGTLVVSAPEPAEGGTAQESVRSDDSGSRTEQHLLYKTDGVFFDEVLVRNESRADVNQILCIAEPPLLSLPAKIGEGMHWQSHADCGVGSATYTSSVEATETVTLGDGTAVDAVRIRQEVVLDGEDARGRSLITTWYDPKTGLVVKLADESNLQYSVYDLSRKTEDVLESLTPA